MRANGTNRAHKSTWQRKDHHGTVSGGQRADSILERGGKRLHPSDTSVGAGHVRQSQQSAERLEGGAATQFNAVAEQWRAAQQQMEQSLESIQHALTQASALYAETEMQASRLFAQ